MTDHFAAAIAHLTETNPKPFFVQVGGFDGVSFDPLRRHVVERGMAGLIVEPIPQYFAKLTALYAGSKDVTPVNCAIAEEDGERAIWRFNPKAVESGKLPPHLAGMSSFKMDDMLAEKGVFGVSSLDAETMAVLRSQLEAVPVPCRTMKTLLSEHRVNRVDILQIDTEGYDYIILKLFDFARYKPSIVHYEHQHLNREDAAAAEKLLRSHGYQLRRGEEDTLGVLSLARHPAFAQTSALCDVASSLAAEGRTDEALTLLEHLEGLRPCDEKIVGAAARVLGLRGETLKALEKLLDLKSIATDTDSLVREMKVQMPAAMERFNAHLAAREIEMAEKYASTLAQLAPGNAAFQHAALCCNVELGRKAQAEKYAATVFALDRTHELARAVLGDTGVWPVKSAA
jgi:FkbM family methyltransferase